MNILLRFYAVIPHLTGKFLAEIFPHRIVENIPYKSVEPYRCIRPDCGRLMSRFEMFPPDGLSPGAICPRCRAALISVFTEECWACGNYIEEWRWKNQKTHSCDLYYRIHDLYCADYFSVISAKALGQNMSFLRDEAHSLTKEHPQYIDVQYQEMTPIPINHAPAALPAPNQEGGSFTSF